MGRVVLLAYLLLAGIVMCQDDPAAAPDAGAGAAGDAGAGAGDAADGAGGDGQESEEAWEYVEFLRDDLGKVVDDILQVTLYEARKKTSKSVLAETVSQTMKEVLSIRQMLLERIKQLRKGEIETDPLQNIEQEANLVEFRMKIMTILLKLVDEDAITLETLKEISTDLQMFKTSVGAEIMRILMLPGPNRAIPVQPNDCSQCQPLMDISSSISDLLECAKKEEEDTGDDAPAPDDAAAPDAPPAPDAPDAAAPDANVVDGEPKQCPPTEMYFMSLITINEGIDTEIRNLYDGLIILTEEEDRAKLRQDLTDFKDLKNKIEELIMKLATETDPEKIKKIAKRGLERLENDVKRSLEECTKSCLGPGGCPSAPCAAEYLSDSIIKMEFYKEEFARIDDEEEKKELVKSDMIKYIAEVDTKKRDILTKKANGEELSQCDTDTLDIISETKRSMWMLVDTAIKSDAATLEEMINAMIELLTQMKADKCKSDDNPERTPDDDGPTCEWDEYQKTKDYLTEIDDIIQNSLFKPKDGAKMQALLGYVKIQKMFDERVSKLFKDELVCPEEVKFIKETYMDLLGTCMREFMNPRKVLADMPRLQRISCTKRLRTEMSARMGSLLELELENSLNEIKVDQSEADPAVTEA